MGKVTFKEMMEWWCVRFGSVFVRCVSVFCEIFFREKIGGNSVEFVYSSHLCGLRSIFCKRRAVRTGFDQWESLVISVGGEEKP